jgi:hypothetical protein
VKTITDGATALATLQAWLDYTSEPALTAQQVSDLRARHALATTWAGETLKYVGDRVVPTVPNGCWYECSTEADGTGGGTTGSSEPSWTAFPNWPQNQSASISDGTVLWTLIGRAPACLWDLRAAAHEGWLMKEAIVAGSVDVADDNMRVSRSQSHAACLAMARRYAPMGIA